MKIGNATIKGTDDIMADVPEMTFTDARNAILQVANFLQGLLIIYQMSKKAGETEVEVNKMEGQRQQLVDDLAVLTQEIEVKNQEAEANRQKQEAGFTTRIDELKAEIAGLYDKIKDANAKYDEANQQLQTKLAEIGPTVAEQEKVAEETKAKLASQIGGLQTQLEDLQKKKNKIISQLSAEA